MFDTTDFFKNGLPLLFQTKFLNTLKNGLNAEKQALEGFEVDSNLFRNNY